MRRHEWLGGGDDSFCLLLSLLEKRGKEKTLREIEKGKIRAETLIRGEKRRRKNLCVPAPLREIERGKIRAETSRRIPTERLPCRKGRNDEDTSREH